MKPKPNPDHSVNDLEIPAELRAPKPDISPKHREVMDRLHNADYYARVERRPWWVCLLKFLARFLLRRKGG